VIDMVADTNLKAIFKGKTPVIYLRVSSQAQKQRGSGTTSQKKVILDWLKDNGIRKKPVEFKDVGSGGNESAKRKGWESMIQFLQSQKDPSQFFVVMRDFSRWSRHVIFSTEALAPLWRMGVELVNVNLNIATGSAKRPDPNGEFIYGLMVALGSRERTGGALRVKAGVDTAREQQGIIGGQPLDLDGQFRELWQNRKELFETKTMTLRGFGDALKPKRGRSWMVKNITKFNELVDAGMSMDEWLEVFDKVKAVRDKFGKRSKEFLAVQRMTSGYLKKPVEFRDFKPTDEQLAEYVKNPLLYQASKGR